MGEFANAALGEVIELKRGYDLPQQDRLPGLVPIVSSSGVTAYHAKTMVRGPGVITGRYGTLGLVFYVTEDFWPLNTTLYVRDFKGNHPRFIYYFLRSLDFNAYSDKAAVPGLNRNHLHLAPVRYPVEIDDQRAIADVLGALDAKIDLNRRMNETLEAMARAIFKDWFVDFGPTRAKMERRAPYLAPEVWGLFPDRLDGYGKPEGWITTTVGNVAEKIGMRPFGSNIKVETFVDAGVPIVSGQHLRGTCLEDRDFNFITEEHAHRLGNSIVKRRDLIFTHAGNIGQVSIIPETSAYDAYILSQRQFYLRCDTRNISPYFAIYFFRSPGGQHKLLANSSQVGVPSISRPATNLKAIELCLPSKATMAAFDHIVREIHLKIGIASQESETLSATRDLLLPKLMSGEIRVKDAEKELERVA
ncbi:MAG TPA: restriction endonuclease subunit S [Roseiarcus sp.]|jgi:type I restriction enzyme S subunit